MSRSPESESGLSERTYYIRYRRARFKVPDPRKGVCRICGKQGPTDLHHIRYTYTVKEVRKEPGKALENTIEVCRGPRGSGSCHDIMNAIRLLIEAEERLGWVAIRKAFMLARGERL